MDSEFADQVQNDVRAYAETNTVLAKLRLVGGISRVLGLFLLLLTVILIVFALLAFGSVAAVAALSYHLPIWAATLIIGSVYILLLAGVIIFSKQLFINPFVRKLSAIFFAKEGQKIEEERLRKEAEND